MTTLQFDLTVDKSANAVYITREFRADLASVWDAFTQKDLLDQWWAPKPFLSKTKVMDFKVGGRRFYAMVSPEGQEHWGVQQYTSIQPRTTIQWLSSFADKDENINAEFPTSEWNLTFTEHNGLTNVAIVIKHKTFAAIEMHLKMGFKEGITMTLNELDTMLQKERG